MRVAWNRVLDAEARFFLALPVRIAGMVWVILWMFLMWVQPQVASSQPPDSAKSVRLREYQAENQIVEGLYRGRITPAEASERRAHLRAIQEHRRVWTIVGRVSWEAWWWALRLAFIAAVSIALFGTTCSV